MNSDTMWKYLGVVALIAVILNGCEARNPTRISASPSPQNVSVNPSQVVNFSIPGGRLLGLLSLLTSLKNSLGGGGFVGRCFGAAKRLKFLIPFFLYKLGVITTTLGFLTLFTLKGLVIGVVLLILNAGGWLAKIGYLKGQEHGYFGGGHGHGWQGKSSAPVHIHVHKEHAHPDRGYFTYHPPAGFGASHDAHSDVGVSGGGHSGGLYSGYGRGHAVSPSGPEYVPAGAGPLSWAERISKGFNVNDMIRGEFKRGGLTMAYSDRASPTVAQDPVNHSNPNLS